LTLTYSVFMKACNLYFQLTAALGYLTPPLNNTNDQFVYCLIW